MKVIDAFWDTRNLGVTTKEIIIENSDNLVDVSKTLDDTKGEYIVVKAPTSNLTLNKLLQEKGFFFAESSLNMNIDIHKTSLVLTSLEQRFLKELKYEKVNDNNDDRIMNVLSNINNGMFTTDRIYLDDFFTKEKAAFRYINWIKDEIFKCSSLYEIMYKNNVIGFFTIKEISKDCYYPFLAGLYPDKSIGLGFSINTLPYFLVKEIGGKKISTNVSTNNSNVCRSISKLGYHINGINNIFIKHN